MYEKLSEEIVIAYNNMLDADVAMQHINELKKNGVFKDVAAEFLYFILQKSRENQMKASEMLSLFRKSLYEIEKEMKNNII